MADLATTFGRRVRELRTGLKMTQPQLAEMIDMSVEWVRRIENGGASPSFDTISALAKALHVPPANLFTDGEVRVGSRVATVAENLSDAELAWLLEGVSLLRSGALSHREGRGQAFRRKSQGRARTAKPRP